MGLLIASGTPPVVTAPPLYLLVVRSRLYAFIRVRGATCLPSAHQKHSPSTSWCNTATFCKNDTVLSMARWGRDNKDCHQCVVRFPDVLRRSGVKQKQTERYSSGSIIRNLIFGPAWSSYRSYIGLSVALATEPPIFVVLSLDCLHLSFV